MAVTGTDQVLTNFEAYVLKIQANAALAIEEVMAALEGWAKSEHGHKGGPVGVQPARVVNGRRSNPPHEPAFWDLYGNTTNSIKGQVAEVSPLIVKGVLSAGMDFDVFLELAKDGKWAFLWPTIENHKDDIMTIIERRMRS